MGFYEACNSVPARTEFLSGGISALALGGSPERRAGPLPLSRSKYSMVNDLGIINNVFKVFNNTLKDFLLQTTKRLAISNSTTLSDFPTLENVRTFGHFKSANVC